MSEQFKSIWGDITVNKVTPVDEVPEKEVDPAKPAPTEVETVPEDETQGPEVETPEEITPPVEEPEDPEPVSGGVATEEVEVEDLEVTPDDVNKAFSMLVEEGVITEAEDDEFDASPTGLADAVAKEIRTKFQEEMKAIPEEVQSYYKHIMDGGDPNKFSVHSEVLWKEIDMTKDEAKKEAIKSFAISQGMTEEDALEEVEDAIIANKLDKKSTVASRGLIAKQEEELKARAAAKKKAEVQAQEKLDKDIEGIENQIDSLDEIANFKLDDKRKQAFKDYLFKANPRTGKTQAQVNLNDEERKLRIAFLDFIDYNKSDVVKDVQSQGAKLRKKKIARATDAGMSRSAGAQTVSKQKVNKTLKIPGFFGPQNIELED